MSFEVTICGSVAPFTPYCAGKIKENMNCAGYFCHLQVCTFRFHIHVRITVSNIYHPWLSCRSKTKIYLRYYALTTVKLEISPHLKEDNCFLIPPAKPLILAGEIVKAGRLIQPSQDLAVHGKMSVQHPIALKQETDQPMSCGLIELT